MVVIATAGPLAGAEYSHVLICNNNKCVSMTNYDPVKTVGTSYITKVHKLELQLNSFLPLLAKIIIK